LNQYKQLIVGSIVTKSPASEMAPAALSELMAAVELLEDGAMHSVVAESSLVGPSFTCDLNSLLLNLPPQPMVHEMRNKAIAVYTASHPLDTPLFPANDFGGADDQDFEGDPVSQQSSRFTDVVALPNLIPGVMQPPLTLDPDADGLDFYF
jgi:hypothetical protein